MTEHRGKWKKIYTVVLVANLIYIVLFYLITTHYNS